MAALASPTPLPAAAPDRRSTSRAIPRLPTDYLRTRRPSPLVAALDTSAFNVQDSVGDSSDDEDLAPIKLSAEAEEILGAEDRKPPLRSNRRTANEDAQDELSTRHEGSIHDRQRHDRAATAADKVDQSPAPPGMRVSSGPRSAVHAALGRDGSFLYKNHGKNPEAHEASTHPSATPPPPLRRVRVSGSRSLTRSTPPGPSEDDGSDHGSEERKQQELEACESPVNLRQDGDKAAPNGPSTVTRARRGDENGAQSTMRIKRIGTGSLLAGPVRRGMIRRASEEDASQDADSPSRQQSSSNLPEPAASDTQTPILDLHGRQPDKRPGLIRRQADQYVGPQHPLSASSAAPAPIARDILVRHDNASSTSAYELKSETTPASVISISSYHSRSSNRASQPVFKVPSLPPLPAVHDQENEPPPTFKRNKAVISVLGDMGKIAALEDEKVQPSVPLSHRSPGRPPLAAISQNTPHRPAPAPPPKMSIIEAATSSAGPSRKKKVHVTINGRLYTRLDRLGSGGSSAVYRVMAQNFNIFAMKRVNLANADPAALAGYRGEIDLLRKLENVERVIRLFDYEVNDEKETLSVLMEMGESDFSTILNRQLKTENAKLDVSFTRYYWKEMLECVQSVHRYDIVHSDLKPANFLLVRGQLKLIDFGIANAIQDDTVNVHRENQIGTPNYMSPESLVCHSDPGPNGGRLLKLGKPSDVWSLGCILYQMTYGQPPFAHFSNQHKRVMSIVDPKIEIQFPSAGVGGMTVPFGLIKTLRRCLQRDQVLRPTLQELLSETDPFLNPVAISADMLGRMISNVIRHCRKKEEELRADGGSVETSAIPSDEDIKAWPLAFYEKLREAQEQGTAW